MSHILRLLGTLWRPTTKDLSALPTNRQGVALFPPADPPERGLSHHGRLGQIVFDPAIIRVEAKKKTAAAEAPLSLYKRKPIKFDSKAEQLPLEKAFDRALFLALERLFEIILMLMRMNVRMRVHNCPSIRMAMTMGMHQACSLQQRDISENRRGSSFRNYLARL